MERKRLDRVVKQLAGSVRMGQTSGRKYEFTVESDVLSTEQREFYEQNGYLVVRKLVPLKDLDRYRRRFAQLCDDPDERVATMTVMRDISQRRKDKRGQHLITKIQDFQDDDELFAYCKRRDILQYVSAFVGPNIKSVHSMLIHKPPNVGETGRHPFHQDLYYFPFRPAKRVVASWTAMEKVTRENGCLSVFPGSHRSELLPHGYPKWNGQVNKAYHGILDLPVDIEKRVHLEMDAGDTVFFHPLLIHGSGANKTQGFRKAISCHYASANCQLIDVKGTVQAPIAEEVEQMALKRAGFSLSFLDVWRYKSRLLAGEPGSFS